MKKISGLLLFSLMCWTTAVAQRSLSLENGGEITKFQEARTERTITPIANGYKVKYEIKSVQLLDDPLFPENEKWQVQGFYTSGVPEYPEYPYSSDSFVIPEGCEATVEVTNTEWISVTSLPSPGRPCIAISDTVGYTIDNVPPLLNNVLISEDKVWVYSKEVNDNVSPDEGVTLKVQFKGQTNIDGRDYYNCYVYKGADIDSSESATLIAYMREDNGKVYVRYIPQAIGEALENDIDVLPYSPVMSGTLMNFEKLSQNDVLVYDSTLGLGDILSSKDVGNSYAKVFDVVGINERNYNGVSKKVFDYNEYQYIEGVGDYNGLLPFPSPVPDFYDAMPWILVEVTDLSGNTLIKITSTPSSVSGLNKEEVDTYYTNLQGIRVRTPQEPGIYIRTSVSSNGEKDVEKVFIR